MVLRNRYADDTLESILRNTQALQQRALIPRSINQTLATYDLDHLQFTTAEDEERADQQFPAAETSHTQGPSQSVIDLRTVLNMLNVSEELNTDSSRDSAKALLSPSSDDEEELEEADLVDSEDVTMFPPANPDVVVNERPLYRACTKSKLYMTLAIWAFRASITHKDWSVLVNVLQLEELPISLATLFKDLNAQLPVVKMHKRPASLSVRSAEPQASAQRDIYYFDQIDLLRQVLSSPVRQKMHFGAACRLADGRRSELWHGDAWAESIRAASGDFPRYPDQQEEAIFPADCIYYSARINNRFGKVIRIWRLEDSSWQLDVQPIIQSTNGYVLVEDDITCISPDTIQRRVRFDYLIPRTEEETTGDSMPSLGVINEVRLNHGTGINGDRTPVVRPSYSRMQLLAEGELRSYGRRFMQNNFVSHGGKPLLCVPMLLFCDGFALYRTLWKSSAGFYICPANLPLKDRKKQANWHVLTLTPFGVAFEDVVACLSEAGKSLSRGFDIVIDNEGALETVHIVSFLLAGIGDMPQQAQNLGCKSQNSNMPCQRCLIKKDQAMDLDYDHVTNYR